MAWVRIDDHAPEHPKLLRAGPVAGWLWVCGLAYCQRHLTDGDIPAEAVPTLGVKKPHDSVARLLAVGLWEETPTGYHVHDYEGYQPSKAQVAEKRQKTNERLAAWRKLRGNAHGNALVTPLVTPLQSDTKRPCNALPVPEPVPEPVPVPKEPLSVARAPQPTGKPLSYRPRIDVAWPGRPPVPGSLHAEFRDKLGGDPNEADAKLRAWYPTAADAFEGQPIGDDDFTFWRARFREWVGTTVRPVKAVDVPPEFDYDQMKANLKKRGVL